MHDTSRLTSIGPVQGLYLNVVRNHSGWAITSRHKHFGGMWTDCEMQTYHDCSTGEMSDIVGQIIDDATAVFGPGDWPEQP